MGNWTRAADGLDFCTGVPALAGSVQITLPVKLISFEVTARNDGTVSLDWKTATEEDNAFFEIQRSTGTGDFETIGRVEGRGSSALTTTYQFIDESPAIGLNLYRIRQVDIDGSFEFFPTRPVRISGPVDPFSVYPNPVTGQQLTLIYRRPLTGGETFAVKDLQGRVLQQGRIITSGQQINTGSLQKGIYLLTTSRGDAARFMIQ